MAKRRQKKRTHVKDTEDAVDKTPKSMVIKLTRRGHGTTSLSNLVKDFRQVMQPHTAIKLRERSTNKLRDFVSMTGPLGVSHLMVFSISDEGNTNLRVCRAPRGPTMQFRVLEYSLCKDISKVLKAPKSPSGLLYTDPPLLVLNGFTSDRKAAPHEALLTSMFQNMFPPISVQDTKVSSMRRVMILNKDAETGHIELRHYAIETKLVDVSKGVKRLSTMKNRTHRAIPNLSRALDISELITDPYSVTGYNSDSEVEDDALVEIEQRKKIRIKAKDSGVAGESKTEEGKEDGDAAEDADEDAEANEADDREMFPTEAEKPKTRVVTESLGTQKRAIKLVELGPRLKLELRKVEEGMVEGKVLYHKYIKKTAAEVKELERKHADKQRLREQRRKAQEENIKKKGEKGSRMQRGKEKARAAAGGDEEDDEENDDNEQQSDYYSDDDLGRGNDDELFASEDDADSDDEGASRKKRKVAHFDDLGDESE